MQIRPATGQDIAAIAALQTASWRDSYRGMLSDAYLENEMSGDLLRHWQGVELRPEDVVLVAEEAGAVVGFIAVWCDPDPYIDNLHVLPDLRSRGTGRRLMQAAAEALMRRGHASAYLWVLEANRRALAFYESLGGQRGEAADHEVFGQMLPSLKVVWPDLSRIAAVRPGAG